jgi:hypothetical protein
MGHVGVTLWSSRHAGTCLTTDRESHLVGLRRPWCCANLRSPKRTVIIARDEQNWRYAVVGRWPSMIRRALSRIDRAARAPLVFPTAARRLATMWFPRSDRLHPVQAADGGRSSTRLRG